MNKSGFLIPVAFVVLMLAMLAFPVSAQTGNSTITGINVTQFFSVNTTAPGNFSKPSNASLGGLTWLTTYSATDWGHAILVFMPLVVIAVAGKHYMWIMGLFAGALCMIVNISLSAEFFSQTMLSAIFFICLMMAIKEGG